MMKTKPEQFQDKVFPSKMFMLVFTHDIVCASDNMYVALFFSYLKSPPLTTKIFSFFCSPLTCALIAIFNFIIVIISLTF